MLQKLMNKLNDLRPRQLLMLAGIAGILMFVAIYVTFSLLQEEEKTVVEVPDKKPPVIEMVPVVVAKVNIPARTRIQEPMLQVKEFPKEAVPGGAIKNFDEVKDMQLKVSIFAGDILTVQKVTAEPEDEGFVGNIPPDCRAVSISVNDITGVAGFAKPGDRVDLLLAEKGQYSATTTLLLQNVPLLSINQDMGGSYPMGENGVPVAAISNPSIATFALQPQEALKLISASKLGDIYMTLRPSKPQSNYVEAMEYTIESINAPPKPAPVAPVIPDNSPAPVVPAVPTTPKIEIIQGDQVTQKADDGKSAAQNNPSGAQNFSLPQIPANPEVQVPENLTIVNPPYANSKR